MNFNKQSVEPLEQYYCFLGQYCINLDLSINCIVNNIVPRAKILKICNPRKYFVKINVYSVDIYATGNDLQLQLTELIDGDSDN